MCHITNVEVRRQLLEVSSSLLVDLGDQTQVVRLGAMCLYLLGHLSDF